ncbi:MAG: YkvA family protein [Bacteroidota bacterium]
MDKKKKILNKAKETISNTEKLRNVVSKAAAKLKSIASESSEWKELRSKISLLIRMVQVQISGEYKAFSNSSLLLIVFALIYFITPIDALPDVIPAVGFTDDASVLYMIYRKLNKDVEAFLKWSGQNK